MTLLGNAFNSDTDDYLAIAVGPGGKAGHIDLIANNADNLTDAKLGQNRAPLADKITDPSMWLVREAFDDFRRLGYADLLYNHPSVLQSGA